MKNWCKIYEFEEFDVLVRKNVNKYDGTEQVTFTVYDDTSGLEVYVKIDFKKEGERDKAFSKGTEEKVFRVANGLAQQIKKLTSP